ncbi:ATP-dependent DNA helicase RecQ [Agromyces sp. 3263]|uniref:RecQ family ATP-dependent DNA helicase n=1 Tax=Agromyces sp. 3263 TaxID=2817750 RepID=UPI0028661355|nr:RecQ family ATP-dependent DNA helicase [Agromyces sp. 3263]MDR6907242.1 ATP-dependent DNA helicase RecQ [Agromyces sp. 3263]
MNGIDVDMVGLRQRMDAVASTVYGWSGLKPGQAEAIEAVVAGRDVLAVMPTGYGKSAIYQVAAHLLDGPTLIVSPLIALQVDQVRQITEAEGEGEAVAVNSSRAAGANADAWEAVRNGEAEFLFLAPEQLAKPEVVASLADAGVSLVVIDEAHCVSSWGHDFRPDYLGLGAVIQALGHPRVLGLTATGSAPVREEIVERLGMRGPRILVGGFDRPGIHLAVERHEQAREKEEAVLRSVVTAEKPGLLYVATRKDTERLAERLREEGLRTAAYHGGMAARARQDVHEAFLADGPSGFDVVVATSAFGMGVDKPNVRFVVHAAVTESLDAYYQEVGRSGRDGRPASAVLHYRPEDLGLRAYFASGRPRAERVASVATALEAAPRPVGVRALADELRLPLRAVTTIVNMLVEGGAARSGPGGVAARGSLTPERAQEIVDDLVERRSRIDESRRAMVRAYAETPRCRRAVILEYFGAEAVEPCGNCDTCDRGTAYEEQADAATDDAASFAVDQQVRHTSWGEGRVMSIEADRITVFFEEEGYRVLSRSAIEADGLLRPA